MFVVMIHAVWAAALSHVYMEDPCSDLADITSPDLLIRPMDLDLILDMLLVPRSVCVYVRVVLNTSSSHEGCFS